MNKNTYRAKASIALAAALAPQLISDMKELSRRNTSGNNFNDVKYHSDRDELLSDFALDLITIIDKLVEDDPAGLEEPICVFDED